MKKNVKSLVCLSYLLSNLIIDLTKIKYKPQYYIVEYLKATRITMEIQYVYLKTRSQFGKQCIFDDSGVTIEEDIVPNAQFKADYIDKNPINNAVQNSKQFAAHEVQTVSVTFKENGMNHTEGGWPKEVNIKDEEAVARYRRRVEKSDSWAPRMRNLMEPVERCILQNNSTNIYENFFDDMVPTQLVLPLHVRTVNVYQDPQDIPRPITHLSWSPDHGRRLAVSYCSMEFQQISQLNPYSFIWEIENPNNPFMALKAVHPSVTIEFNPRDPSMLISGLMSGQVCCWDIRTGNTPSQISHPKYSHKEPANCALWINSKTNTEFFSSCTGGIINWWDIRNLRQPSETLIMDLENPQRADEVRSIGVSSLQYETTMGTKFLAGMENGIVISATRKGKNPTEKLALRFDCHNGPVVTVTRNPFSTKNFLTIGDWTARIWAEDTKEGNLMSTRQHSSALTGGCWSTSRYSVFYVINDDGVIEVFDILVGLNTPVTTIRLCENSLKAITPHEEGKFVAVGSDKGTVYLVESSQALTTNAKNDKALLTSYLERCSRYEKAVDNRLKETRLAIRLSYLEDADIPLTTSRGKNNKNRARSLSGQGIKKGQDDKKIDDKAKIDEKEKKKIKHRKSKNIWELLGDAELADAERQYLEAVHQEMEKYAEATVALGDASEATVSTLALESKDPALLKKKKIYDSRRNTVSRTKGRFNKNDKIGKINRNEEIVIVRVDDNGVPLDTDQQTDFKDDIDEEYQHNNDDDDVDDTQQEQDQDQDEEKKYTIDKEIQDDVDEIPTDEIEDKVFLKEHNEAKLNKPCGDDICDPMICCLDKIESTVTLTDEDAASFSQNSDKEKKMNTAIVEILADLPKNILPSQLENLPCYTRSEKRQILAMKDAPPSVLKIAVNEAKQQIKKIQETPTTKKYTARLRLNKHQDNLSISNDKIKSINNEGVKKKIVLPRKIKKMKIPSKCQPIDDKFGSKEILGIIGKDIKLVDDAGPSIEMTKLIESLKYKGDYPRISAVNIDGIKKDDD